MISSHERLPASKQKLEICNEGTRAIEVMVEMTPERYVLRPKDKLVLIADAEDAPRVEGFTLNFYDGGIQIYAAWDGQPSAYINGQPAETDYSTEAPTA
ncbi:hypothetical protein [Sphingomonas sp. Leaf25]|uniref:hypothetical protein n=1 Tax=Sphingomonas sp. Leaf25 TaxID=1735692 RepID=UPI000B2A08DA|nr:hypothetical protein [Sphingomonas sp. Leaf25]